MIWHRGHFRWYRIFSCRSIIHKRFATTSYCILLTEQTPDDLAKKRRIVYAVWPNINLIASLSSSSVANVLCAARLARKRARVRNHRRHQRAGIRRSQHYDLCYVTRMRDKKKKKKKARG